MEILDNWLAERDLAEGNSTMAAVSEANDMLALFERLALEAGREIMRVYREGYAATARRTPRR